MMKNTLTLVLALCLYVNALVAKEIDLAVSLTIPPYVISEHDKGMELDVVKEALRIEGYSVKTTYFPLRRVSKAMESGNTDAALTINEKSGIEGVYYSESHITYQNVAFALEEKSYTINQVGDLKNYSVIAFQNATKFLGKSFAEMAKQNSRYQEKSRQNVQMLMLLNGKTDVVVMDKNIFKYFSKHDASLPTAKKVKQYAIFPPTHYKVGFKSKEIRDDFDRGLKKLKQSGRYQEIINSYIQ